MFEQKQGIETGRIKYISGNRATVEIIKPNPPECKSCRVCAGIENVPHLIEVDASPDLILGQLVTLKIIECSPYKSMILLLVLPLISLMIGCLIGQKFSFICQISQDMRMVFCGFLFFILSLVGVSLYDKKEKNKKTACREIISTNIQKILI